MPFFATFITTVKKSILTRFIPTAAVLFLINALQQITLGQTPSQSGNQIKVVYAAAEPMMTLNGGDNTALVKHDTSWGDGCGNNITYRGDVFLTDTSYALFGPNINAALPLPNVPGVVYN